MEDNSPGIFMTKAFRVLSIEIIETPESTGNDGEEEIADDAGEITDVAEYIGRADPHSIEVRIIGVPEEKALRVFQLSDEIREGFDDLGLKEGDNIIFSFKVRGEVFEIFKIEKK